MAAERRYPADLRAPGLLICCIHTKAKQKPTLEVVEELGICGVEVPEGSKTGEKVWNGWTHYLCRATDCKPDSK